MGAARDAAAPKSNASRSPRPISLLASAVNCRRRRNLTLTLRRHLLPPAVKCGPLRQHQQSYEHPAETPLPDARHGLLVGALSLRFRERLGLFQLTFLRHPFGFGSLALLLQLRGVRRLALAEKRAGILEARAVALSPRGVGRVALLPLPGIGEVGLAP